MEFGARGVPIPSLLPLLLFLSLSLHSCRGSNPVGVCYGRDGDNLPTPLQVVSLLQSQLFTKVRIFDADSGTIQAFGGTNIELIISVGNDEISGIALDAATANSWVNSNVVPYASSTRISHIAVGSEVLMSASNLSAYLVPAMKNIYSALQTNNVTNAIKVSSSHAMSVLEKSYPPSAGVFINSLATSVVAPMLEFLSETGAPFMLNSYPYYSYVNDPADVPLDYALFESQVGVVDSNNNLHYTSLFDAQIDAVYAAMAALNFSNIPILVSETGWPSRGDADETAANVPNAEAYNQNLINHIVSGAGTPLKSGQQVETYIFSLYNEDQKPGQSSERNFGIYNADGTAAYTLDFEGGEGVGSQNLTWCVARSDASNSSLLIALNWACGPGGVDCDPINAGGDCFLPDTYYNHASFAFNSYYQNSNMLPISCNFSNTATLTQVNPSYGSCNYPARKPNGAQGHFQLLQDRAIVLGIPFLSSISLLFLLTDVLSLG